MKIELNADGTANVTLERGDRLNEHDFYVGDTAVFKNVPIRNSEMLVLVGLNMARRAHNSRRERAGT